MLNGFKKFILQGNIVDLAVGVVIGVAFNSLVAQFTGSFIEPAIKLIGGGGVDGGSFKIDGVTFDYGAFINAIITFALTAAAVYFFIVVPMNALRDRRAKGDSDIEPSHEEKVEALLERIANR